MRLISFDHDGEARLGVEAADHLIDLSVAAPSAPRDLMDLIRAGPSAFAELDRLAAAAPASARRSLHGLKYRPPLARPGKLVCLGLNYVDHAAEAGAKPPEYPTVFFRGATSLIGHGAPIRSTRLSPTLDFEGELAAVMGRDAWQVSEADALDYVAGYACFNDATIREYQRKAGGQWTVGKNFDGTGGFGPAFVTADALPPGAAGLKIQTRLNGAVMQDANTSQMIFSVAQTIGLLSQCMTLEAGDVLVMGTPSGIGAARTPPVFMKPGDRVEVEIEGVGLLANPIG
ncbi:MAG: fumarylacetoacetate hydrolase family protein [Caulobacterales bacterium]